MDLKRITLILSLIITSIFLIGCESSFLPIFSRKVVGVNVTVLDTEQDYQSMEDEINEKLVDYIMRNKKINAVPLENATLKNYGSYMNRENRLRLMQDLGLDCLLIIKLDNFKFDTEIKIEKTGNLSFEEKIVNKYWLDVTYYLYDPGSDGPVLTESSTGFYSSSDKLGDTGFTDDRSFCYTMSVVNALKKTQLNKAPNTK